MICELHRIELEWIKGRLICEMCELERVIE